MLADKADVLTSTDADPPPTGAWRQTLAAVPSLLVALLPKVVCPACWPMYASLLGMTGLTPVLGSRWLLPVTAGLLACTLLLLARSARRRGRAWPLYVGAVAATLILCGKFLLEVPAMLYGGTALLFVASTWGSLSPPPSAPACGACARH